MQTKQIEHNGRYVNLHSKDPSIPEYFLAGKQLQKYLNIEDWCYHWKKEFDEEGMIIDEKPDYDKNSKEFDKIYSKIANFFKVSRDEVYCEGYCDGDGDFQITKIELFYPSRQWFKTFEEFAKINLSEEKTEEAQPPDVKFPDHIWREWCNKYLNTKFSI
jgi:hypothetical protein